MLVIGWCFYNFYLIDIKYDSRVIVCNVEDDNLNIYVNGQSVWNTDFVIKQININFFGGFDGILKQFTCHFFNESFNAENAKKVKYANCKKYLSPFVCYVQILLTFLSHC